MKVTKSLEVSGMKALKAFASTVYTRWLAGHRRPETTYYIGRGPRMLA